MTESLVHTIRGRCLEGRTIHREVILDVARTSTNKLNHKRLTLEEGGDEDTMIASVEKLRNVELLMYAKVKEIEATDEEARMQVVRGETARTLSALKEGVAMLHHLRARFMRR